jgi:hypothetical protein
MFSSTVWIVRFRSLQWVCSEDGREEECMQNLVGRLHGKCPFERLRRSFNSNIKIFWNYIVRMAGT